MVMGGLKYVKTVGFSIFETLFVPDLQNLVGLSAQQTISQGGSVAVADDC
jgi:hypothetical protein